MASRFSESGLAFIQILVCTIISGAAYNVLCGLDGWRIDCYCVVDVTSGNQGVQMRDCIDVEADWTTELVWD